MLLIVSIGFSECDYGELARKLVSPEVKETERWMWNQLLEGLNEARMASDEKERLKADVKNHWEILVEAMKDTRRDLDRHYTRLDLAPSDKRGDKQPDGRGGEVSSAKATKGAGKGRERNHSSSAKAATAPSRNGSGKTTLETGHGWNRTWSTTWTTGAV